MLLHEKIKFVLQGRVIHHFFLYWQAEQISYRNIGSKMNISPIKGVFRAVNGVIHKKIKFVLQGRVVPHFLSIGKLNIYCIETYALQ